MPSNEASLEFSVIHQYPHDKMKITVNSRELDTSGSKYFTFSQFYVLFCTDVRLSL